MKVIYKTVVSLCRIISENVVIYILLLSLSIKFNYATLANLILLIICLYFLMGFLTNISTFFLRMKCRTGFLANYDAYEFKELNIHNNEFVRNGVDSILKKWCDNTIVTINKWVHLQKMMPPVKLLPFYVFVLQIKDSYSGIPSSIKSFYSHDSPAFIFLYDEPQKDNLFSQYKLYHEMGHIGYRGTKFLYYDKVCVFKIIIIFLMIILYSNSNHNNMLMICIFIVMVIDLINNRLYKEIIADNHAIYCLKKNNISTSELNQIPKYFSLLSEQSTKKVEIIRTFELKIREFRIKKLIETNFTNAIPFKQDFIYESILLALLATYVGLNLEIDNYYLTIILGVLIILFAILAYFSLGFFLGTYDIVIRDINGVGAFTESFTEE